MENHSRDFFSYENFGANHVVFLRRAKLPRSRYSLCSRLWSKKTFLCFYSLRPGFRLVDNGTTCVETENPYLMVVKKSQIVDVSVKPEDEAIGHLTPVVDLKYGRSVDYDTANQRIFWTEMDNEVDVNGTLYMSNIGGGDKVRLPVVYLDL